MRRPTEEERHDVRTQGRLTAVAAIGAVALATAGAAGCGGRREHGNPGGGAAPAAASRSAGGTLNMLGAGDVDYMDPNISYYSLGYLGIRHVEPAAVHLPGRRAARRPRPSRTSPPRSRPRANGGISATARPTRSRIRPRREVEHLARTPGDGAGRRARRQAHVQPGPAVRRHARTTPTSSRAIQTFCDGFAKAGNTRAGDRRTTWTTTDLPGVKAKDDLTVVFKLTQPGHLLHGHADHDGLLAGPEGVRRLRPGQPGARAAHGLRRSLPGRVLRRRRRSIIFTRNPAWDAPRATRSARRTSTRSSSTRRSPRTRSSSSCRPARRRADMEFDDVPPPSQLPALIAEKDPNLNLGETSSSQPLRRLQHGLAEQQRGAGQASRSARRSRTALNRDATSSRCSAARRSTSR